MDINNKPQLPQTWSGSQNIWQFFRAGKENILNIIPPSTFEKKYTYFRSRLGSTHYISDPQMLREILKTRAAEFPKSRIINACMKPIIPNSVFVTSGKKWRQQHDMMIPVFKHSNTENFIPAIEETTDQFMDRYDLAACSHQDIVPYFQDLTFEIIAKILIGDPQNPAMQTLRHHFERYLETALRVRLYDILYTNSARIPNIRSFQYQKLIRAFQNTVRKTVIERLENGHPDQPDFLEMLIEAYDLRQNPKSKNIAEIGDNLATFIIAGHETSAMALAWGVYALSFFQEAQTDLAKEASLPMNEQPLTKSTVQECLRLFPSAPIIIRQSVKKTTVQNITIKKNDAVFIPIIAIHRHRDYWQKPDDFVYDRFVNFEPLPMSYLPFGAGPRICIGASFAMMELQIILSKVMSRFAFSPSQHIPSAHQTLTLRAKNGIQVVINKRAANT